METKALIKKDYSISGMTCSGCVETVTDVLKNQNNISELKVQLDYPQAVIESEGELDLATINKQLGKYTISTEKQANKRAPMPAIGKAKKTEEPSKSSSLPPIQLSTYKPLLLIVGFIAGVSLLVQYPFEQFSGMLWMRHFMAGFFLVFSFFKLLNLSGFASSYRMYDIVAAKWKTWGFIYPFVELGLGVAYLINFSPFYTNLITVIVLGVSSIGVIKSNLNKRKIKCACLGDVFNLPMSTVTIIEDLAMVGMAAWMLFVL
ncbi:heavy-metal-associated domain-containing protein [Marinoscillum sp.]|uniref:heavy-metal-associated domain-containing protein n=1 Tax=Marinoscillum sp. TaxID=2024838 RepID=UPI003BA849EC